MKLVSWKFIVLFYFWICLKISIKKKKFKHLLAMIGYEKIRTKDRVFDQMNSQCFRVRNSPFLMILP